MSDDKNNEIEKHEELRKEMKARMPGFKELDQKITAQDLHDLAEAMPSILQEKQDSWEEYALKKNELNAYYEREGYTEDAASKKAEVDLVKVT